MSERKIQAINARKKVSVEIWGYIISLLLVRNDVKRLLLVSKGFHYECQSRLWRTVNLGPSRNDPVQSDSLYKLGRFLELLHSNGYIARHVLRLILPSRYASCTTFVHRDQAVDIIIQLRWIKHLVILQPRRTRQFNAGVLDTFTNCDSNPRTHRPEYCSFYTKSMVLCFRPTIVVLEGMFPGSDIAKAFIGAQPTLRVWKGNHRRELPYFVEGNFSPPPLSSISIMSTEHHYYNEIISSPILQSSVRGFQIRSNCDPQSIFLSMQSFAALESLAIQVPNVESTAFLAKMATVLPRLRRLTLDSQIIRTLSLIPEMLYLEYIVVWLYPVDPDFDVSMTLRTDFFGALPPLCRKCPLLTSVDVPDFTVWSHMTRQAVKVPVKGRQIWIWGDRIEEVVGLPTSRELKDCWIV